MKIEIHPLQLSLLVIHARCKARNGMSLTDPRKMPSLAQVRSSLMLDEFAAQLGNDRPVSWAKALPTLEAIKAQIDAQMAELGKESMR